MPSSPYRSVKQALDDPQLVHRQALAQVSDRGGVFNALNPPFRFSETAVGAGSHAAALGEHTREVLREIGYDDPQIDALGA